MIEAILYVLLTGLILYLAYLNVVQRLRFKKLNAEYFQTILDYQAFRNEYEKLVEEVNRINVEKDNGFVKFLSESRDWAFTYIEDVQHAIFVLKEKYDDKEDIDEELKELFSMLSDNKEKQ